MSKVTKSKNTCGGCAAGTAVANDPVSTNDPFVVLVGAPNAGKTTLYNQLTGSRFRSVNYPGSTVDYHTGKSRSKWGDEFQVLDSPGTYSLFPKSPEERVTRDVIFNHPQLGAAHTIIAVVDGTHLSRHLYVVKQLKEAGFHVVVAVTMIDLLEKEGRSINIEGLSKQLQCPVATVCGLTGEGVQQLVELTTNQLKEPTSKPNQIERWRVERHQEEHKNLKQVSASVLRAREKIRKRQSARDRTKKIDKVLLHPTLGVFIFAAVMFVMFSSIFWMATPFMDWIDAFFGSAAEIVLSLAPEALWADFLANGIIASVGAVLIFVPQIAILFLGITLLEDSGYLARAASLIDKPLSKIGLNGRAFVPILSGYACAIPGMMAARAIANKKERWITLFILPLMSCSARLPVYALLLAFLFVGQAAWMPGLALAGLYFGSLFFGAIFAAILNKTLKSNDKSFFMMELPHYRRPHLRSVFKTVWMRASHYVKKAGPVIFVFAVIIWAGTTFPNHKADDAEKLNSSYAAMAGQAIEPVMEPMGGDWRTGASLIAAFAAREVFVASMAMLFNITEEDEDLVQNSLLAKMNSAKTSTGAPLFTVASVIGLMIFFMIALQCMATFGVARREFGNWRAPVLQLVVFNVVAYALAVAVVQGLRFVGIA